MSKLLSLQSAVESRFKNKLQSIALSNIQELTVEVSPAYLFEVMQALSTEEAFAFESVIDICGVDYLDYGESEWSTDSAAVEGFSRGVEQSTNGFMRFGEGVSATIENDKPRFAVVYHLLSYRHNWRLRVRAFCENNDAPMMSSVESIWPVANWFEREAFDMYGILFEGHSDLRRILTDYGFVGYPLRKDFPLVGHVEMRYDEDKGRVVYEPVSIEPRVLVPRAIRKDNRFDISKGDEK